MKIGIDARLYRSSVAGIGRYSQNLIKNILELDHENEYILLMTTADKAEFLSFNSQFSNVKIVETKIGHYSLAEQTKLPKILEAQHCDFWHFLNFNLPISIKDKFIVTIHDLTLFFYPGRNKKSLIHKWAYKFIFGSACRHAKRIIAVSESTKKDIIKTFGVLDSKIQVVYEAADDKSIARVTQEDIDQLNSKYNLEDIPLILYVGQWRPHKNILNLIKAFDQISEKRRAKLAIVGKIDLAFPEVNKAIDKSPYLRDIIKSGFIDDKELASFYKRATVFVFPSFYEGFGLPGLEAMAAGTAVASSNRTSLPEIYGDAACYFNPDDSSDMAEKILKVIENKNFREELIEKGKQNLERFSWQKTAKETLEIYKKVI